MTTQRFRLCYTEMPWAWFTDADDFDALHTDDWDDGYRPGAPYTDEGYELLKVAVDGRLEAANFPAAPETINSQELTWLETSTLADTHVQIPAKCSLDEFIARVHEAGGEVYIPADRSSTQ